MFIPHTYIQTNKNKGAKGNLWAVMDILLPWCGDGFKDVCKSPNVLIIYINYVQFLYINYTSIKLF